MSHQRSSGNLLADRRYAYAEACLAEGHAAGAAEMAEQALEMSSDYAPAWVLLGRARAATFAMSGAEAERAAALEAFGRALALDPDDVLGSRLHLAGLGAVEAATAIGPAYVRALFEGYALRFERHLVDELGYRGPQMMVEALDALSLALPDAPRHFPHALDLGCGTGLMGRALAGRVGVLAGCDLSPAMLAQACRTGLYARLAEADLVAFLAAEPSDSADLVTAADVFIYLGDLAPALRGIAHVLAPGGLAILTVQSPEAGEGIVLGDDGRYAHGDAHLDDGAEAAGLAVVALQQAGIRRQKKINVPGRILILQRPCKKA
ncbi:methyltransferase type 12 [Methylobacterium sp. Leaf456]|uniref:class I SAM-dependent DNA methyltransferase n=1 Tax=Methylobacterium sp. Leaf456 TaxID=1736382 RepID=UPI0006FFD425|nr:methyltransferase [Methylobacterium sp. Leaf456]KQT61557.1 methyltransferase type 12 [Methylobacterium sp. Leaf456]